MLLQRTDLNRRPLGYEPSELPNCSTLHVLDPKIGVTDGTRTRTIQFHKLVH